MSNFTTFAARTATAFAAVFALGAQAGDFTPEGLALIAAPWRPMAAQGAQAAKQAPKVERVADAADEAYDYDAPAGGWHVPGTPVRPASVSVAARR